MKPAVLWFRRDLRLADHPALAAAMAGGRPVVALFVIDERLIRGRWPGANRVAFMLKCLESLRGDLRQRGSELHLRTGDPLSKVPQFCAEAGATDVYVSRDYSSYARRRDASVADALSKYGIGFHARRGVLVHEPEEVSKADGSAYGVYSPFHRAWQTLPFHDIIAAPEGIEGVAGLEAGSIPSIETFGLGEVAPGLLEAGEAAARARLDAWCDGAVTSYAAQRDLLGEDGTSRLGQDLRWGTLSANEAVNRCSGPGQGRDKFVAEVAWRDFYYHVLWQHPRVVREPYQAQFATLRWRDDDAAFGAWRSGATGYPVVDAAMRQLLATGWMHNRARMVAASFLAKHLLLDWRRGEAHFMAHLVDGDVANNDGGWQWAASTGVDPQPYFRIFNPTLQGKKFDPEGAYVRRWLPGLASVPTKYIHEPWTMPPAVQAAATCVIGSDYPAPIVDHREARARALAEYGRNRSRPPSQDSGPSPQDFNSSRSARRTGRLASS